jgi:hypothetical protein
MTGIMLVSAGAAYPYPVKPDGSPDNEALRRWGRAHGFTVHDFGQVPGAVRDAWRKKFARQILDAPLIKAIEVTVR